MRLVNFVRSHFMPVNESEKPFGLFEAGLFVVAAIGLTVMQFGGSEIVFYRLFGSFLSLELPSGRTLPPQAHDFYHLIALGHWSTFCLIGYFLLPVVYLCATKRKVSDYYLSVRGFFAHAWIYFALYALVLVAVIIVSFNPQYQKLYPFYPHASRSVADLVAWELLYGIQFFALEFFFRGFLIEGLRKWAGYGAVFIAVVPYCMLHFGKTFSETCGSILAGIALGTLAMRYRSIWGGVFLHWSIAITMDVVSLIQKGELPSSLWW